MERRLRKMTFTEKTLEKILRQLETRKITSARAFKKLKNLPYETLGFAKIDHHRSLRKGFPEAVYAPGKTIPQLEKIIQSIRKSGQNLIVTRIEKKNYRGLRKKFPNLRYSEDAQIAYLKVGAGLVPARWQTNGHPRATPRVFPTIAILTAGTSDISVAEEAAITLELIGRSVIRIYDCGVAGLHRLLDQLPHLQEAKAIICIAGMEGALASVVAGLVDKPVIAVPTSVGYGASFKGIAPLLTMLNSCAQGVAVVNIDNGFGAACFAASIAK